MIAAATLIVLLGLLALELAVIREVSALLVVGFG